MSNAFQPQDPTLYWWNGRPCRIVQRLGYGDRTIVQIDLGGVKRQVHLSELSDRNIVKIPDALREALEILRSLLVKISNDPFANQYNYDELITRLQNLADSITGLHQQLQSVQWGNVQGNIQSQADLQTLLNQRVSQEEFAELWQQQMQQYLHSRYHQSQPLPPYTN